MMRHYMYEHNTDFSQKVRKFEVRAGFFSGRIRVVGFDKFSQAEKFAKYLVEDKGYWDAFVKVKGYWVLKEMQVNTPKGWTTG